MPANDGIGKLEENAVKRRERIEALRNASKENATDDGKSKTCSLPKPVFRNYNPQDDSLKESKLPPIGPMPIDDLEPSEKEAPVLQEVDLLNLAPRKVDWDLKRNIAKKLEKLERRTQRAIAELIREKLKAQQSSDDN